MATYVNRCNKCGHQFESTQSMKDESIKDCPKCNENDCVGRVVSSAGGFRIYGRGVHNPTSRLG